MSLCRPGSYSFCLLRWFQMLYLHRNSLALWSKVVSPHRLSSVAPSNAPHLRPCLSSWWVWLSPLRAHRFELEAACGGICWSTIAISWLYFLLNWVGRKAQKLSKGRQGSVKAKDVTRSESLSKCEYLGFRKEGCFETAKGSSSKDDI